MRKSALRAISFGLIGAMLITGNSISANATSLTALMPAAGIARALNEGKSVTSVQADKIRSTSGVSANTLKAGASVKDSVKFLKTSAKTSADTATAESTTETAAATEVSGNSIAINDTKTGSEASLITVGAGSTDTGTDLTAVSSDAVSGDNADVMDLVNVVTETQDTEDETFTNLIIAQVDDYVNVRDSASEDGEVLGKLYNNSVGDLLEVDDGWYKIKSGSVTGFVKSEYCVSGNEAQDLAKKVGTRLADVNTTTLYVRSEPAKDASVIGMVPMDDELQVLAEMDGWVKVSVEEGDGYVSSDYVKVFTDFVRAESKAEEEARLAKEEAARKAAQEAAEKATKSKKSTSSKSSGSSSGVTYAVSGSGTGSSVASYALQFVGNPYVYGGTSLTNGTDCSGFVMGVYRNFGVSLPHSSGADRSVGYEVAGGLANAQPGDIVCYSGHVALYIGNGQIVHASTAATGIKVSNVGYRTPLAVRRIF